MKGIAPTGTIGHGYCPYCGNGTGVVAMDNSFDHAFGTEHEWAPVSQCCGADMDEWTEGYNDTRNDS